jgi:NAD(P)-dependent dehydrogenase (short-subunit alcohol dehydrogenase family)
MSIKNTYALILGGSSGLGLATAHKLAAAGYHIVLVHRTRKSDVAMLSREIGTMESQGVSVVSYNKDALKSENISAIINELEDHSVSVLVHSIAKGSLQPLLGDTTLTKEDLDITIHAMGTSWWQWTRALLQANKGTGDVRNIAFTSEGNTTVWQGYGAVSAAKATLEALMRQMAVELAPLGIKTNCIQAGATQTPSFEMIPGSESLAAMALQRNPFGRMTSPKDVANAVYLLCRPEAIWINGTILKVDGGESLR